MEYREIDLNEWEQSGAGATATSYNNKKNPDIMLKLFTSGITGEEYAGTELELSRKVESLGLSTPKALELVKAEGCFGVIYQRIRNKSSISRLCADNPADIARYASCFATECKTLHSLECERDAFPSRKADALKEIATHKGYTRHTREVLTSAINRLEDNPCCLHGDMQPGNIIVSGENTYWIDLGFFAWGNPVFDLSCLYFFCMHAVGQFLGCKLCHLTRKQLRTFWDVFSKTYSDDPEGLTKTARENVLVYLAYTIGLENYTGLTAKVFDAYINASCLMRSASEQLSNSSKSARSL